MNESGTGEWEVDLPPTLSAHMTAYVIDVTNTIITHAKYQQPVNPLLPDELQAQVTELPAHKTKNPSKMRE